ncbi:nectin-3-like protein isoform X3 [Lepisosteus oculatus]|uniref:nectin-3-like protein isoform X3 n=1 Tax=Lepisosteus oculatus TaxID=7918 RepID=UPI003722ACCC
MAGRMSFHCHRTTLGFPGTNAIVLLIICILTGVGSNEVIVDPRVTAVLGKNITLMCTVEVGRNLSLTQTSWERKHNGSTLTLAVFNPIYGISIAEDYKKRLFFKDPSNEDATIVLEDVGFADTGVYTCKVATFPLGNTQASTMVTVMVEPKVYVSAGSAPLIDGGNETVVATCTAERGKPRAEVSWESDLFGRPVVKYIDEANGTSTMEVQYRWKPTRLVQGRKLTCVVRHPALETEFRIPYVLNVQYAPVIQIKGYDNNWFAGRENVQLVCQADANPPPARYIWTRLDKDLPPGVQIVNGTLSFNRALDRNDSGIYQCDVANDIGHQHKQMDISIQDVPSHQTSSVAVAGAVIGAVLALFLIAVFIIVLVTPRKREPSYLDKVIDLPPTHKPHPTYMERTVSIPLTASTVPSRVMDRHCIVQDTMIPDFHEHRSPKLEQLSYHEWICHNSGSERVYINHREHYV